MPSPQFPIRPENHARLSALLADTGNNAHCGHGERRRAGLWRVGSGSFHSTGGIRQGEMGRGEDRKRRTEWFYRISAQQDAELLLLFINFSGVALCNLHNEFTHTADRREAL